MNNYELIIIWNDGSKEVYGFRSEEKAERTGAEMKKVFGDQITWYGTRRARS